MRLRWVVLAVFVISSALNYLDRQILPALAPAIQQNFHLTSADYGLILGAFSVTYAVAAPFAGWFIDRVGLNLGIALALGCWSVVGAATGLARSAGTLAACRAGLGIAQAGGVPATGKAIAHYLHPDERALGNALSQIGIGAGAALAVPIAVWLALHHGWRSAFVVTGAAGLLWIPIWIWASRLAPRKEFPPLKAGMNAAALLRDPQLWSFVAANVLSMTVYTLWTNWTTVFLVTAHHMTLAATASVAWLPPVFFNLGGLLGGWLSLRWVRRGAAPLDSRMRACFVSSAALLGTAAVPLMPAAGWAVAAICFSSFWASAMSVNLYTMPLDVFGAGRAAFAVSMLTAAYGAMQAVFSPLAGWVIDRYGFAPVCTVVAVLPLAAWGVLKRERPR